MLTAGVVPNFDHHTVQINDRVRRIQRAPLPGYDLFQHAISEFGNEASRDDSIIHFLELIHDFPCAQALDIRGQNLIVNLR